MSRGILHIYIDRHFSRTVILKRVLTKYSAFKGKSLKLFQKYFDKTLKSCHRTFIHIL